MKTFLTTLLIACIITSFGLHTYAQNMESLFLQKKYDQIVEISEKKLSENKLKEKDYYWFSMALNQLDMPQENLEILNEACEKFPSDTSLQTLLAHSYYELGDYKTASPLLSNLSFDKESQLKLAKIKEFYGEYLKAVDIYKELLTKDEKNLFLLKKIGRNYYKTDSFPNAIEYLNQAIEIYATDIETLFLISKAYEKNEDYENCIHYANIALEIDSTQTMFLRQAGKGYFQQKEYKLASDCFMKCYELNDTSLFVQKLFGISNHRIDMNFAAEVLLKAAHQKDSTNFELCYFLGRTLKENRKFEESLYYLNKANEINQPNTDNLIAYHIEMIGIRKHFKEYHALFGEYLTLYELTSDPQYIYYMGSTAQFYLKDKELAYKNYERFLSLTPEEKEEPESSSPNEMSVSIRKVAEENYNALKKELFFEGKLTE